MDLLDAPLGVLYNDLMERLNLNLPEGSRARIQAAAKKTGRTESDVARDLLMDGLARLERAALLERLRTAQTAELHARKREILTAMEHLRGAR